MKQVDELPDILTLEEVAELLRVSVPTLRKGWQDGSIPAPIKLGRRLIWPKWKILEYLGYSPAPEPPAPELSVSDVAEELMGRLAKALLDSKIETA